MSFLRGVITGVAFAWSLIGGAAFLYFAVTWLQETFGGPIGFTILLSVIMGACGGMGALSTSRSIR